MTPCLMEAQGCQADHLPSFGNNIQLINIHNFYCLPEYFDYAVLLKIRQSPDDIC